MNKRLSLSSFLLLTLMSFLLGSCNPSGDNFKVDGVNGPFVKLVDGGVQITIHLENLVVPGGGRIPLDKNSTNSSYIEFGPVYPGSLPEDIESDDGTLLIISLSAEDILKENFKVQNGETLPGGRPLPGGMPRLPAFGFNYGEEDATFYFGNDIAGVFIPLSLDIEGAILTFSHFAHNKKVGTLTIVGNDEADEHGGILLLLNIDNQTKRILKGMVRH